MSIEPQPQFAPKNGREGSPVGRLGDDHGFWDETWTTWHGGFVDETAASAGCAAYADKL